MSLNPQLNGYLYTLKNTIKSGMCVFIQITLTLDYSFSQSLWYIFSDQNWNSQNYLFNLHIIESLVHIKKAVSHFFEHVANALVHSCKWLCTILCSFLHYQLLMSCWSKCIVMGHYWIVSPPQHLGIRQVVIICQPYFYTFPLHFFSKSVLNW